MIDFDASDVESILAWVWLLGVGVAENYVAPHTCLLEGGDLFQKTSSCLQWSYVNEGNFLATCMVCHARMGWKRASRIESLNRVSHCKVRIRAQLSECYL